MSRPRLHVPPSRWAERVALRREDKRHLIDVLRLREGRQVEVFDGQGQACPATLIAIAGEWFLELGPVRRAEEVPPGGRVTLAVALLKGRKMDDVIRMATEIGIGRFLPFASVRAVPRLTSDRAAARRTRWRGIAQQAARQSGRTWVPEVSEPLSFAAMLKLGADGAAVLLHERADAPLLDVWPGAEGGMLAVGPEGGFDPDEVRQAEASGFTIAGLGLPVLRAQTAAVVAAAFACLRSGPA